MVKIQGKYHQSITSLSRDEWTDGREKQDGRRPCAEISDATGQSITKLKRYLPTQEGSGSRQCDIGRGKRKCRQTKKFDRVNKED